MNLNKFNNYIKDNPTSDDTNLKRLNVLKERERNKTKENMEKINKMMKKADKRIDKLKKEIGL